VNTPSLRIVHTFLFYYKNSFLLEGVFITHTIWPMKKVKTNLTIDPKVKRKGEQLAKKNGLSFSAYVTTLLVRELAESKK